MVAGIETTEVTKKLDTLHNAITHDTPITQSNLSDLTNAIQGLSIDIGGASLSVAEVENGPIFKRNMEIFKEIQGSNVSNYNQLTFITTLAAEYLSENKGYLDLYGLPHSQMIKQVITGVWQKSGFSAKFKFSFSIEL